MNEAEELAVLLSNVSEIVTSYWKDTEIVDCKVCEQRTPEELQNLLCFPFPADPLGWNGASSYIEQLLKFSPRTRHPLFLDKLYPGTNPIGVISELIIAVLNTNLHVFKVSPVITMTELAVMETLCSLFGLSGGDGITCPGGSFSNMLAMITARNLKYPEIKREGCWKQNSPLAVFTSDQAHYSIKKACMVLGIGIDNMIIVPTDTHGAMKPDLLCVAIESARQQGKRPFFVNGTAGTTVRGSYDPFSDISKICKEQECWFHIDACWGGSAIFSSKHKYLLNGCENADSIAWNAHKMLGVPIQTSILLMKEKASLAEANSLEDITYLFHDDNQYDVGNKTIMCGRRADILKFYISWIYYGSTAFENWVDHAFENAKYLADTLKQQNDFEVLFERESVNVCFVYSPEYMRSSRSNISQLNIQIEQQLTREGKMFIDSNSSSEFGVYFRAVFHSPLTTFEHLDKVVTEIRRIGEELEATI